MTVNQKKYFCGNRNPLFFCLMGLFFAAFASLGDSFVQGETQKSIENRVLLLVFTSESCPACQKLEPLVTGFEKKNYPIRRLSPQNPSDRPLYEQYQIETIPSFVFLVDGQETDRLITQGEKAGEVKTRILQMFADGKKSLERLPNTLQENAFSKNSAENLSSPNSLASLHDAVKNGNPASSPIQSSAFSSMTNDASVPLAATVRIRIPGENQSVEGGTGTLIHVSDSGKTREGLILTCGHLFRETQGKESVNVDLFDPASGQMTTVQGECVYYDDDLDIGFVGVPLPFPMKPARLAPPGDLTQKGDTLVSVGCSAGEDPTAWNHNVLSVDKKFYQPKDSASDNRPFYFIEVSNAPQAGRSGGGLFKRSETGEYALVGVCNAGDPRADAGYFLPASVVYDQLYANKNLTFVYEDLLRSQGRIQEKDNSSAILTAQSELLQSNAPNSSLGSGSNGDLSVKNSTYASAVPNDMPNDAKGIRSVNYEIPMKDQQVFPESAQNNDSPLRSAEVGNLNSDKNGMFNAGLEELKRCHDQGAEIICIINWPEQANSPSPKEADVIRLNRSELP